MKPMKIAVTVIVELRDPSEWTAAFGVEGSAAIREDVKTYVVNGVSGVFGNGEVTADVYLKEGK